MVNHPYPFLKSGTPVEVFDRVSRFVGIGFYHPHNTVAVKLLSTNKKDKFNKDFFCKRLKDAKTLRESVAQIGKYSDSYRLVHAEGDLLSGIVIDKYANCLVVEPYTAGTLFCMDWIAEILVDLYPECKVCFRSSPQIEKRENVSFGELARQYPLIDETVIEENSLKMIVNFKTGHKTGYFLDQRDNHRFFAQIAKGKAVLDLFSYTGGFGLTAAINGASSVVCVDLDEKAIELSQRVAKLNNLPQEGQKLQFKHADAFNFLREAISKGEKYDAVVVDPSKLASVQAEMSVAIKKYGDINKLALSTVVQGGIFVTCSCSGMVSEEKFLEIISNSANDAGKVLKIIKISGAGCDHPFSSNFFESRYLKSVFAFVYEK